MRDLRYGICHLPAGRGQRQPDKAAVRLIHTFRYKAPPFQPLDSTGHTGPVHIDTVEDITNGNF